MYDMPLAPLRVHSNAKAVSTYSTTSRHFTASQNTPLTLRKQKIHFYAYRIRPSVPILRQIDPVHALQSYFFWLHSKIIILPSAPIPSGSPTKIICAFVFSPVLATYRVDTVFFFHLIMKFPLANRASK